MANDRTELTDSECQQLHDGLYGEVGHQLGCHNAQTVMNSRLRTLLEKEREHDHITENFTFTEKQEKDALISMGLCQCPTCDGKGIVAISKVKDKAGT